MPKPAYKNSKSIAGGMNSERARVARTHLARVIRAGLLAGLLVGSIGLGGPDPVGLLDLPVQPTADWQLIPLRNALGQLGASVSEGYVLFGLEQRLSDGKEPRVNLNIKSATTLGTALRELLAQLPPYEMEIVSGHLIGLRPIGAKHDGENILNLRVTSFDKVSEPAYRILEAPQNAVPELNEALRPKPEPGKQVIELYFGGSSVGGPLVTLHLKNVTIRDIINATAVATEPFFDDQIREHAPLGWVCSFNPDPSPGNSKYSWGTLFSMPKTRLYRKKNVQKSPN